MDLINLKVKIDSKACFSEIYTPVFSIYETRIPTRPRSRRSNSSRARPLMAQILASVSFIRFLHKQFVLIYRFPSQNHISLFLTRKANCK